MFMEHGTYMRYSNSDQHSDNNNNHITHSVDPQQDNAGVKNLNVSKSWGQYRDKNANMSQSKLDSGWK